MPVAKPPEFRRRAVDLVRRGEQSVPQIAKDLGISESCLRRWVAVDDVDAGRKEGTTSDERRELVELRRRNRVLTPPVRRLPSEVAQVNGTIQPVIGENSTCRL